MRESRIVLTPNVGVAELADALAEKRDRRQITHEHSAGFRPLPSVVAIEPQFHPALRRFSMMISQYFTAAFAHRAFGKPDRYVKDPRWDRA
jgi:hypothetical protein